MEGNVRRCIIQLTSFLVCAVQSSDTIIAALVQLDSVLCLITSNNVSSRADALFITVASQLAPTFIGTFQHNLISTPSHVAEPSGDDTVK